VSPYDLKKREIMKKVFLAGVCLLAACQERTPEILDVVVESRYPDINAIELPANESAAEMTREFLEIMDAKMMLAAEIGRIETRDQYVREVFIDMFSDPTLDADVRTQFQKAGGDYVEAIDELNTNEFKDLMRDKSWRQLAETESRLAARAFSIVQHTNDDEFQRTTLAQIEPLAKEGLMDGQHYALMYDRVQLKTEDGQQLYGSQTKCIDGQYDVHKLAAPESVDERRAAMGMGPLAPYLEQLRDHYGPCTDT
jgi:hypothetical protein